MNLVRAFLAIALLACSAYGCAGASNAVSDKAAMVVSVSSDGRYAVSSHVSKRIVLWDLERRKKKVVSRDANIYSAYFIKDRDVFIWQGMDNVVHVQRIDGSEIVQFPFFPTYGHVMGDDLTTYCASDSDWNIFCGWGAKQGPLKKDGVSPNFFGNGKLLNLSLTPDNRYLLSAGFGWPEDGQEAEPLAEPPIEADQIFSDYGNVVLWDLKRGMPEAKLPGHAAKAYATFSPDGQMILTASENTDPRLWDRERQAVKMKVDWLGITGEGVQVPKGFDLSHHQATLWLGFIDDGEHFLRVSTYEPYALLYHVDRPQLIKYIPLGKRPRPSVGRYVRNAAFDTAPAAGILVTGQEYGSGINVYQYHPDSQTLELLWSPR